MLKKFREIKIARLVRISCWVPLCIITSACNSDGHNNKSEAVNEPETVVIESLPLPPTAPSSDAGSCTSSINPNGTGCISLGRDGIDGARTFTPDGKQVYVSIRFAGAPEAPDPASIYSGGQLILVKTDGSTFDNGDGWRCVTCGIPDANKVGINNPNDNTYPEAFHDGMRVKMGTNILDCSPHQVSDTACTPESTHIYPIISPFLNFRIMRELRLHLDNVHLGWNQLFLTSDLSSATQFAAFGRLEFNPAPNFGPPGYELHNVSFLLSPELGKSGRFFSIKSPGELMFEPPAGVIGEFRGFTPDGKETLGIGTQDSFNYDIFATSLQTGASRRLTRDPAYTDPANISPDGKSLVIMDGRVTEETGYPGASPAGTDGRLYFASAGIGVPPLIDLAIAESISGIYTLPARGSFLQPYLIDLQKVHAVDDPEIHDGQQLNAGGDPDAGSGSISDPLWLGGADPAWSPDSTAVVYYQRRGCNPEPAECPPSTEPGGRDSRLMIARLTDREPSEPRPQPDPDPVPDEVPWGTPYTFGDPLPPVRKIVPSGNYVLMGESGSAEVVVTDGPSRFNPGEMEVTSVSVIYSNYSADGVNFIDGTESGERNSGTGGTTITWHADLTFSGLHEGSRKTREPGGFVVTLKSLGAAGQFSGTLTTTLDGMTFNSPE
ncbi:TolB family protein [Haliea sp. E17]|uniref:TolB family protein n=1 Tax=Haliea sp. E17 TaxID=3401576 RepID=UPI003AAB9F8D